ncbi:hypothetical protein BGL_1c18460 [Burkholderia plantarii]|uniref:Uncharacterized protein n=1 Tax=Burkholderia plantarii TaxID=41899 RepID=A0A0B6RZ93_BURPL|nr:hypothetical protein BGL_1c18460 [Burkholderia plantarii]
MVDISNENDCYLCVADTVATLCNAGVLDAGAFVMDCVGPARGLKGDARDDHGLMRLPLARRAGSR